MKNLTVLVLIVSILLFSVVPVYADFTGTDSTNLSAIKSAVQSGGALYGLISSIQSTLSTSGNLYGLVNSIKSSLTSTSSGSILSYLSSLNSQFTTTTNNSTMRYFVQSINSALSYDGQSVARYAFRIWNEMPTLATQSTIASHVDNIFHLLATGGVFPQQLLDDVSNINTYVSDYLYPISTGVQQSATLLTNIRASFNGYRTSFFGSAVSVSSFPVTYLDWDTLEQSSAAPSTFYEALLGFGSLIQQPLARLSYVHASDEEIAIRDNASTAQNEFDTHFLDENGLGHIPDTSYGDVAGISSDFTSAFTTNVDPSSIFAFFDSSNDGWLWFSVSTYDGLDSTPATRKSRYDFDTPLLDKKLEELFSMTGGGD